MDVPISSERDFKGLMKGSSVSMDTCISRDSPDSRELLPKEYCVVTLGPAR
jgi:hypothetical protein